MSMDDGIRLAQVVEELIAETTPLVRIRDESGNVDQRDRDEPDTVMACPAREVQLAAGAGCTDICDPDVGINRGDGIA